MFLVRFDANHIESRRLPNTSAINLGNNKRAYRRNGMRDYIVWQVFDQRLA
jgi:hypothetical protein